MSSPIKNVLVVGASGDVGRPLVKALLEADFNVTALTRESSSATFSDSVRVVRTDYSPASLVEAFQGQDAVVSTIASTSTRTQTSLVDSAIAAGVKVFLPSEFGVDTAASNVVEILPGVKPKIDTVQYLKSVEDKISWAVVVTGALFDWGFAYPGFGGWNVSSRTAVIYDGGNIPFEATNLDQTGNAVVAILKNPELSRNQYVYVNSFTTTQNEVLKALENSTGEKFQVTGASVEATWKGGLEKAARGGDGVRDGVIATIHAAYYGKGNVNNYSATRGLWNEKLGLPKEDLVETVKRIIATQK
jgi:nucleoside-diphosphate-sugar epimerase